MTSYTHAGVSTLNGVCKVRFANDAVRVKVLAKNGHTGIDIVELREPMSKEDAVTYLLSINFDNGNAVVRRALEDAAAKAIVPEKEPKTEKGKATKAKKTAPTMEVIKAKVAKVVKSKPAPVVADPVVIEPELEDQPF